MGKRRELDGTGLSLSGNRTGETLAGELVTQLLHYNKPRGKVRGRLGGASSERGRAILTRGRKRSVEGHGDWQREKRIFCDQGNVSWGLALENSPLVGEVPP